jgi:hypothetical protein
MVCAACPEPPLEAFALPILIVTEPMATAVFHSTRPILASESPASLFALALPFIFTADHAFAEATAGWEERSTLLLLARPPPVLVITGTDASLFLAVAVPTARIATDTGAKSFLARFA